MLSESRWCNGYTLRLILVGLWVRVPLWTLFSLHVVPWRNHRMRSFLPSLFHCSTLILFYKTIGLQGRLSFLSNLSESHRRTGLWICAIVHFCVAMSIRSAETLKRRRDFEKERRAASCQISDEQYDTLKDRMFNGDFDHEKPNVPS